MAILPPGHGEVIPVRRSGRQMESAAGDLAGGERAAADGFLLREDGLRLVWVAGEGAVLG